MNKQSKPSLGQAAGVTFALVLNMLFSSQPGLSRAVAQCTGKSAVRAHSSEIHFLEKPNLKMEMPGVVHLEKGEMLLSSGKEPLTLIHKGHALRLLKEAIVLVKANQDSFAVVNLTDSSIGAVELIAGGNSMKLHPGVEAVFTAELPSLASIFAEQETGRRSVESLQLDDCSWVSLSEVNMTDKLKHQALLKTWRAGKENQEAFEKVLKTCASLQLIHQYKEPFQKLESGTLVASMNYDKTAGLQPVAQETNKRAPHALQ